MQNDKSYYGERHSSPQSHPSSGLTRLQLSAKLMDRLEKLARWRIDPSRFTFPTHTPEFRGGSAIVSRAILNESSIGEDSINDLDIRNSTSQKIVAVKKLKITSNEDSERILGLMVREAGFLGELSHQNIIRLEGIVEDFRDGVIWLVLPWEENGDLRDFIASGEWEIPERIWLIDNVSKGLAYLHSQEPPICHGDLKSLNILVNSECCAVITDFGSARRLAKMDPVERVEDTGTQTPAGPRIEATFCAATNSITLTSNHYTLRWAAPELLAEDQPSLQSDIWALGWISYEVMTNTLPFGDVNKEGTVISRVIRGDLPSITGHARMSLVQSLCSVVSMCWNEDPIKRPMAEEFQMMIQWMPKIAPNPKRNTDTASSGVRLPLLLLELGWMHETQGDYLSASNYFTKALSICTDISDSQGRAEALFQLADLHRLQDEADEGFKLYSEALEIFTDTGNQERRADVLWGLAQLHWIQKDYNQAAASYSEALQAYSELGDNLGKAFALLGLAQVHGVRGEYGEAITFFSDALHIYDDIGNRQGKAVALWGLADTHRVRNNFDKAIPLYDDALKIHTDIGDELGRANTLLGLADLHKEQSHHDKAIEFYEHASEIYAKIGRKLLADRARMNAADVRRLLERVEAE